MTVQEDLERLINSDATLRGLFPRSARYRYWHKAGREFHYTTETVDGKYWAQEFKPVGPGSQTIVRGHSKAQHLVEVRRMGFRTRKLARARALSWYTAAYADARANPLPLF